MSRKKLWIGVGFLAIIIVTVSISVMYFHDDTHEEYSWGARYTLEITVETNQSYAIVFPLPVYADYLVIENESGEVIDIQRTNETPAGFIFELSIVDGNGSFEIVETEKGWGLQVNGKGNLTIEAEKRETEKKREENLDGLLGNHMSLMDEGSTDYNFTHDFSVYLPTNTSGIGLTMEYGRHYNYEKTDGEGNPLDHRYRTYDGKFSGSLGGVGWKVIPGYYGGGGSG